jgi:hypothetical protein
MKGESSILSVEGEKTDGTSGWKCIPWVKSIAGLSSLANTIGCKDGWEVQYAHSTPFWSH